MEGTRTRLSELIILSYLPVQPGLVPSTALPPVKKIMCLLLKQQQGKVLILSSKEVAETLIALANRS